MTLGFQRLHHLGFAARNMERSERFVTRCFDVTRRIGPVHDPLLKADLLLLEVSVGPAIEIICGKAVEKVLQRGVAIYHPCYEVAQLEPEIERLAKAGGMLVVPPTPAVLFGGKRVAFIQTVLGLIELVETV